MRSVMTFAAMALGAAVIVPHYAAKTAGNGAAAPVMMATHKTAEQPAPVVSNSRSVTVSRNAQGHFELEARVDGRRLDFMVDTGASTIALTAEDAATLGIHPAMDDYRALVRTANGVVKAAVIQLDRVEVEDVVVRDVNAIVMPEGALSQNLLGMSFLSRLHRWEFADGKLVLEQ